MPVGGIQVPSSLSHATAVADPILESHVFGSGIHLPEHSGILSYMYPQFFMVSLLERVGATEAVAQSVFSWNEMDRTRDSATISSIDAGNGTTDLTVTVDVSDYFVVGDLVINERNVLARVKTVSDADTIIITKYPSGNWSTGASGTDIDTDETNMLYHVGTAFEEGSSAPKGRVFLPSEKYNYTTILRRTASVTGSELTNKTYLGQSGASPWFWANEEITMKEFARDQEGVILFGKRTNDTTNGVKVTRGILDYVFNDGGVTNTYASGTGIVEADLQNMIVDLVVRGGSSEYTVLAGSEAFADMQVALKDYVQNGSLSYGSFGKNLVGLDFQSYKFFNKTLNLVHYELFDDGKMVPIDQTATANILNFQHFTLWLDLGLAAVGEPNIKMIYKELDGRSRKFVRKMKKGVTDASGDAFVASGDDRYDIFLLAEISLKLRNAHRMGVLYANS